MNTQRGVALVLVLWLLALLTVLAANYSRTSRTETVLTVRQVQIAQARALAEAGIWMGIREMLHRQTAPDWRYDETEQEYQLHEGSFRVSVREESGKIDLNVAANELLTGLFRNAGMEEVDASRLLYAILDWRDRDNLVNLDGAEDNDYYAAGYPYGARDGLFNSVGELQLVKGMTNEIFQNIAPVLTVYSHFGTINPEVASGQALLAVPGAQPDAVSDFISARSENPPGTGPVTNLPGLDSRFLSSARNSRLTVSSTGIKDMASVRIEAVVLLAQNPEAPFSILSWQESMYNESEPVSR